MLHLLCSLDQHVVHVYFYILPNLWTKHVADLPLVGSSYIFQTKRHYFITKQTLAYDEGCFLLACLLHFNLVVS